MHRFALLPALCLALVVGACGGGGAADADPAAGVPRDALFYMEATVQPEGELRSDALDAAGKVLRASDPQARIRELLGELGDDFDPERDLEPWLGERAAFWISERMSQDGDPGVAGVITATDLEQAEASIDDGRRRSGEKVTGRSHAGVDYEVDGDGFGVAYVEDFVIMGAEPELKRTIDALEGDGLAGDERYRKAIDGLEDERLAHFYFDTRRLFELARQDPESAAGIEQLEALIPLDKLPPAAGALMADGSKLTVDIQADIPRDVAPEALFGATGATGLVEDLPADSWYAQGMGNLGETADVMLGQFGGAIAQRQLEQRIGLDLERDLESWAGEAAAFVRGESLDALGGGVVIEVTDEDALDGAFGRIVGGLRSRAGLDAVPVEVRGADMAFAIRGVAPQPIVLARGDGKVVVAYGTDAAVAGLSPDDRLGDGARHERAREVLGDGTTPTNVLWVPSVVKLIDSTGPDVDWNEPKLYVSTFDVVAAGGAVRGGEGRVRIAAGLR